MPNKANNYNIITTVDQLNTHFHPRIVNEYISTEKKQQQHFIAELRF